MTAPIQVSRQTARRFVLGKQGLWPGRRWTGKDGTRAAVTATEHLQLDPLVILARSHDLMLHSRVAGYQPTLFDELAYGNREFFDWGGWLAVRPMSELPHWRVLMRRNRGHEGWAGTEREHRGAIEEMRAALRERETVSGRDFQATDRTAITNYRGSKDSSLALYYLWRVGEAMTHHRERFERVYAATERVAPAELIRESSADEAERFMALKAVAFLGIGRIGPLSRAFVRTVTKEEERALERSLVELGALVSIEVEGWKGTHFVLGGDVPLLEEVARGEVPAAWTAIGTTSEQEVTFLSPLDPVSARGRAKPLFDFDYVWEIYKPAHQMVFGRYTMPILWGDRLVGRLDAKLDRKTTTLVVNGIWLEDEETARSAQFREALAAGMRRMKVFLGASSGDTSAVIDQRLRAAMANRRGTWRG
ncbi:MAG: crosslink repair DNA glycosylase YcaQ family protein [Anaerolineaceae bacterium]